MGKHRYITLQEKECAQLENLVRTGHRSARKLTRARVLLLSDRSQGKERTGQEVADAALCSVLTVRRICARYHDEGLDAALSDKGWPGAKPKLNGEIEAKLTMLACSEPPAGQKRWTLRLLADQMVVLGYIDEVSHVTIAEWLKKTNSSPGS
jgi:transposase